MAKVIFLTIDGNLINATSALKWLFFQLDDFKLFHKKRWVRLNIHQKKLVVELARAGNSLGGGESMAILLRMR